MRHSAQPGERERRDKALLFDDEAVEASTENSESDRDDESEQHFFPHFMRLPIELRYRIWQHFCPDLVAKARVYRLQMVVTKTAPMEFYFGGAFMLKDHTRAARAALATHSESRALALKTLPDTLPLGRRKKLLLRLNLETDLVYFTSLSRIYGHEWNISYPEFTKRLKHMALYLPSEDSLYFRSPTEDLFNQLRYFPLLRTIYIDDPDVSYGSPRSLHWCTSNFVHQYTTSLVEDLTDIGSKSELATTHWWPNLKDYQAFASSEIPRTGSVAVMEGMFELHKLVTPMPEDLHIPEVAFWPLVVIEDSSQPRTQAMLEKLRAWSGRDEDWTSDDEDNGSSDVTDEYESEGIDDSEIDEDDASDEDEDDLVVQPLSEDEDANSSAEGGSSGQSESFNHASNDGLILVRSSDSEPETHGADRDDDEGTDELPGHRTAPRSRKHGRRVVSSPSEGSLESIEAPVAAGSGRQPETIVVESGEEEDEDDIAVVKAARINRRLAGRAKVVLDDTEGEGSSDQDEEEDDEPGERPLSLFEKLERHRQQNPIPLDDSEDASGGEEANDSDSDHSISPEERDEEGSANEQFPTGEDHGDTEPEEDGW